MRSYKEKADTRNAPGKKKIGFLSVSWIVVLFLASVFPGAAAQGGGPKNETSPAGWSIAIIMGVGVGIAVVVGGTALKVDENGEGGGDNADPLTAGTHSGGWNKPALWMEIQKHLPLTAMTAEAI